MARYRGPILKKCRALGITPAELGIDKKSKKELRQTRKKASDYSLQLKEKQKVKFIYGVLEKQFRGYYDKASRQRGITGENMLILLESRLDNVVFRMTLAKTRGQARQLVNHGLITVNGKRVNIPSYLVKAGDVIEVREASRSSVKFKKLVGEDAHTVLLPQWLEREKNSLKGTVTKLPVREDVDLPVEEHLIVELYSK